LRYFENVRKLRPGKLDVLKCEPC